MTQKAKIIPWINGAPFWCGREDNREHLEECRKCPYMEEWNEADPDPVFAGYEMHCKLVRYRDHTSTSAASPCIRLTQSDCPLSQTNIMDYEGGSHESESL